MYILFIIKVWYVGRISISTFILCNIVKIFKNELIVIIPYLPAAWSTHVKKSGDLTKQF